MLSSQDALRSFLLWRRELDLLVHGRRRAIRHLPQQRAQHAHGSLLLLRPIWYRDRRARVRLHRRMYNLAMDILLTSDRGRRSRCHLPSALLRDPSHRAPQAQGPRIQRPPRAAAKGNRLRSPHPLEVPARRAERLSAPNDPDLPPPPLPPPPHRARRLLLLALGGLRVGHALRRARRRAARLPQHLRLLARAVQRRPRRHVRRRRAHDAHQHLPSARPRPLRLRRPPARRPRSASVLRLRRERAAAARAVRVRLERAAGRALDRPRHRDRGGDDGHLRRVPGRVQLPVGRVRAVRELGAGGAELLPERVGGRLDAGDAADVCGDGVWGGGELFGRGGAGADAGAVGVGVVGRGDKAEEQVCECFVGTVLLRFVRLMQTSPL